MLKSKKEIPFKFFPENLFGRIKKKENKLYEEEKQELKILNKLDLSKEIFERISFYSKSGDINALNEIFIKHKEMFKESEENLKIDVDLYPLRDAGGLKLPEIVEGNIYLGGITSATNVKLPKKVGGDISLISLMSTGDLILPLEVGGEIIFLDEISYFEKEELQKNHPHLKFSF